MKSNSKRKLVCGAALAAASVALPHPCAADAFRAATIGSVKPEGWLLDRARAARDGYTGHMDDVSLHFRRAWSADWNPRGQFLNWDHGEKGSWCSEAGCYWFDGLVKLAWELDDPDLKEMAAKRLEPVLANMHENAMGFLWWMDRRDEDQVKEFLGVGEWQSSWVLGIMGRPLSAYAETTDDARSKQVLEWGYSDENVASRVKGPSLVAGLFDAWRKTGGEKIRRCLEIAADKLARESQFAKQPPKWLPDTLWTKRDSQWALGMPSRHGVGTSEELLSVWRAWQVTGDEKLRDAVLAWYAFFDKNCRQPYGVTMMDEEWGWAGAKRGTETCDVAAESHTRLCLLASTGDGKWGDDVERAQFNAAPACVSRDFRRHVYFQMPNRTGLPGDAAAMSCPWDDHCEYRESKQWPLCCVAALNRILPNYIRSMWMETADGGVAATAYGPCRFATQRQSGRIAFVEKTDYPFSETIDIEAEDAPKEAFPLLVRVPGWCDAPSFSLNGGETSSAPTENGFWRIERKWVKGDVLRLSFPMKPRVEIMRDMNDCGRKRAIVSLGPLLMAYAYPASDDNTVDGDPAEPVLDVSSVANAKVVRKPMPDVWDWPLDAPVRLVAKDAGGRDLALVPYGCTKLRVSMFPVEE